jgi:hypothetical protein
LLLKVTRLNVFGKRILWHKLRSYWEHVEEHTENLRNLLGTPLRTSWEHRNIQHPQPSTKNKTKKKRPENSSVFLGFFLLKKANAQVPSIKENN